MNKLVAILKNTSRSEIWATLEYFKGRNVLTFREQEAGRMANDIRKPKPPLFIAVSEIPQLRTALEAAEAELRSRGLLPSAKPATGGRA